MPLSAEGWVCVQEPTPSCRLSPDERAKYPSREELAAEEAAEVSATPAVAQPPPAPAAAPSAPAPLAVKPPVKQTKLPVKQPLRIKKNPIHPLAPPAPSK